VEHWTLEQIDLGGALEKVIIPTRKTRMSEIAVLRDGSGLLLNAIDGVSNLSQIVHVSLQNGAETRITNDLNTYFGLTISDDASRVITVQRSFFKDVWVGSGQDISTYRKVTSEPTANLRVNWTPDGRLVYDAVDNNRPHIRIMNADGTGVQQLTPDDTSDFEPRVTPDGRFIVFTSMRSGERKVWRMGIDGGRPEMLNPGDGTGGAPFISPDGENVYFVWTKSDTRSLGVVPTRGGPVVEKPLFSENYSAISPDGKRIAYTFYSNDEKRFYVGIRPIDRAEPETIFRIAPTWFLYWPAGGEGLFYRELEPGDGSDTNVMFQPISGGDPRPYLSVAPDQIFDFALAADGKRAALIRGRMATDAVLLSRNPAQ
jgi:Tol biopolymer transport system component